MGKMITEYERLKAQKDAILAKEKAKGDALMQQLEGTLMGKLRETEAERDQLRADLAAARAALAMAERVAQAAVQDAMTWAKVVELTQADNERVEKMLPSLPNTADELTAACQAHDEASAVLRDVVAAYLVAQEKKP